MSGILKADGGEVQLGSSVLGRDDIAYKAQLGYVPDATDALPELRAGEYIALVQSLKRASVGSADIPAGWLERLGVPGFWRQRVSTLSFGQRKRLCTAAALSGDPWLLIFDEPSNGLDPSGVDLMVELIASHAETKGAVLCATNDDAFAERIGGDPYVLAHGRLTRRVRP